MTHRSINFLGLGMITAGILCYVLYWAIGIKLDYEQIVHEPFFLIPISWITFVGGSIILTTAYSFRR